MMSQDNQDNNLNNEDIDQPEQNKSLSDYESIEERLKEIEDKITNDQNLDMDETLKLYEEAVDLGMKASQAVENNVLANSNSQNNSDNLDNNNEEAH